MPPAVEGADGRGNIPFQTEGYTQSPCPDSLFFPVRLPRVPLRAEGQHVHKLADEEGDGDV